MKKNKEVIIAKNNQTITKRILETLTKANSSVSKHLVVIAKDKALVTIDAKIVVEKEAANARAVLKIETLVLGNSPKIVVLPQMEVKNSTATVWHSVSTVRLEEEAIFYVGTRGLSKEEVTSVLLDSLINYEC
jgi:Fe-S cluster assembly scaffold protein SufB